jgi:hypothetical protein
MTTCSQLATWLNKGEIKKIMLVEEPKEVTAF